MAGYPQQQMWNQASMQQMQPMQPQIYPPQQYQPRFVPQAQQMQQAQQPMQQMPQIQQPMQPQEPQPPQIQNMPSLPIYGRYVTDVKDLSAGEVPMDKNYYFFPRYDLSVIYAKHWDDNGVLQTYEYHYHPDNVPQAQDAEAQNFNAVILERLDKIEEMLANNKPNNYYNKKKPYRKPEQNTEQVKEQDDAVSDTDA